MKKFAFQIILLLVVIMAALYFYRAPNVLNTPFIPFIPSPVVTKILNINNAKIKVEVADTKEKRGKGLGDRQKLATDEGMLFIFEKEGKYDFWMKGMLFPLDFVWIRGDTVLDITKDIKPPLPSQADESLPIYTSKEAIDKVLEVNAGTLDKLNIKAGNRIIIQ